MELESKNLTAWMAVPQNKDYDYMKKEWESSELWLQGPMQEIWIKKARSATLGAAV